MKNIILALLTSIIFISKSLSQISLEHTYNFQTVNNNRSSELLGLFKLNSGDMYAYVDNTLTTLYLYNNDHSLFKQISIQKPNGFSNVVYKGIYNVSDNLFNTDNKVEYLIHYTISGDSLNPSPTRNAIYLYNEVGNQLFSKEYSTVSINLNYYRYSSFIQNTPSGTKMILMNQDINDRFTGFSVYSLPGQLLTDVKNEVPQAKDKSYLSNPFPNPANNYAAVFYSLPNLKEKGNILIYDNTGNLIKSINVDGSSEYVLFNNMNLSNGMYFYSLVVNDQIIDSKKMIINR